MMIGPAGSGKTTAGEKIAEALDVNFYPQSVGAQTTKSDLLGFIDGNGNYRSTIFREAYENGGVFLLDELDSGNPNTITILNAALSNGYMSFPDGVKKMHEDFYCIAAANTYGTGADRQYVGRNQLDAATLDRFNTIYWEVDEQLEKSLCSNKQWQQRVSKTRAKIAKLGIRYIVSPRATFKGEKLLQLGMEEAKVVESVLYKNLRKEDIQRIEA